MATTSHSRTGQSGNRLLDRLRASDFNALAREFEGVPLPARQVVARVDDRLEHLYFPVSAVLSLFVPSTRRDNDGIEIATVGCEGMVGFTALLGVPTSFHRVICQLSGDCLRLPMPFVAEAMASRPSIDRLIKKYMAIAYRTEIQGVVCNALHPVEQRVCRWLLAAHERASDEFSITHDSLAARLGVKRPTVSLVANSLGKAGLISYNRGMVRVLDRERLERAACDCFKITKIVYQQLLDKFT